MFVRGKVCDEYKNNLYQRAGLCDSLLNNTHCNSISPTTNITESDVLCTEYVKWTNEYAI
jgi:hypothetical protein